MEIDGLNSKDSLTYRTGACFIHHRTGSSEVRLVICILQKKLHFIKTFELTVVLLTITHSQTFFSFSKGAIGAPSPLQMGYNLL